MNYEEAIKQIQDNLIVISEVERRTAEVIREHAEIIHEHNLHLTELEEARKRYDLNMAEITDKLNGLIGYMDGQHRPPH